jgi:short chain dehydrogenase
MRQGDVALIPHTVRATRARSPVSVNRGMGVAVIAANARFNVLLKSRAFDRRGLSRVAAESFVIGARAPRRTLSAATHHDLETRNLAIQHQTALVGGASGGIGRAISTFLAEAGLRVAHVARDRGKLEEVRKAMGDSARAVIAPCNLTDREATAAMVESVAADLGSIDVLICAAGINVRERSLKQLAPADWGRLLATNLTATYSRPTSFFLECGRAATGR